MILSIIKISITCTLFRPYAHRDRGKINRTVFVWLSSSISLRNLKRDTHTGVSAISSTEEDMEVPLDQGEESSKSSSSKGGLRTMPFIIGTFSLYIYVCMYIYIYVRVFSTWVFVTCLRRDRSISIGWFFAWEKEPNSFSLFQLRCLCLLLTWKRVVQKGPISPSRPLPSVLGHVGV